MKLHRQVRLAMGILMVLLYLILPSHTLANEHKHLLRIGGSGTDLATIRQIADKFMEINPQVRVEIPASLGSRGALKAVVAGVLDIGLTSRPLLKREERFNVSISLYAKTPLVFAVGNKNPVSAVSIAQLAKFYSGDQKHWENGSEVRMILRPMLDSDTLVITEKFPVLKKPLKVAYNRIGMPIMVTDQDAATGLTSIPGALGTSTLALMLAEQRPIKALKLNGISPSAQSIENGQYPLFKELYFVLPKIASQTAREFIKFLGSTTSEHILKTTGHQIVKFNLPD